jgi:exonuclease III
VDWLAKTEPDIVCLQELKAEQRAFPAHTLRTLGYRAVWQGERSWNGVAILARDHDPVLTRSSLPGNPRTPHPADMRQQREQHADYDQLNAASARDASSRRE